jgi:Sulfotransferase domain
VRAPDFFIVGHPKCGTTAMADSLGRHPQIFVPAIKEPQFLATDERYRGRPEMTLEEYLSLFVDAGTEQKAGEASVLNLWSKTAAAKIADLRPDARIIAIFREPASFLRSLHLQFVQGHAETEKDFRAALALDDERLAGTLDPRSSAAFPEMLVYSSFVRYVDQLRRYRDLFPTEQILVLVYEDFRDDNEGTMRTVLRFLDVDDSILPRTQDSNPTVAVRSLRLNNAVRSVYKGEGRAARAAKSAIKAVVPSRRLRRRALAATQERVVYRKPDDADAELMAELRGRYRPEVEALGEYLDRDLLSLWGYDS